MNKLAKKIKFGTRKHTNFKFCGIRIQQHKNYAVELDQEESLEMIEEIKIDKNRSDDDRISEKETTEMRGRLGSLLYLCGNTRPFECYAVI